MLEAVTKTFFGPFRVSVLFDTNGANTTAAAAVLAALRALAAQLAGVRAAVLAATGPVGQRAHDCSADWAPRLAVGSRSLERASTLATNLHALTGNSVTPFATGGREELDLNLREYSVVIAAGAAGVTVLPADLWTKLPNLKVLIDLNAVPPLGIEGIEATDKNAVRGQCRAWGALGVGGTKMKIHKKSIQELFTASDKILDAEQVLELGHFLS